MDKTRKNYIFEINENDLYMKNKDNENKNNSSKTFKKNIWINTNNIIGKETIFNNINNIVTENKEKIKKNKREISDLIDLIKGREYNPKNKMQKHNTTNEKNFVKNGLNQIYTKTLVINKSQNKKNKNTRIFNSNVLNSKKNILISTVDSYNIKTNINHNGKNIYTFDEKPIIYFNKSKSMKRINVKSANKIYKPKKASLPKKYIYDIKRKYESPIYHKKNTKYNKNNEYYFFTCDKENLESENDNKLRMTYSKKCNSKSNPNFFKKNEKIEENNLNLNDFKHFFERDIDDLSSIHNNSSFDFYTSDYEENKTKRNNNIINKNSIYIKKRNTNKIHLENNNNTINQKIFSETTIKNRNKINIKNQKFAFDKETINDKNHTIKSNLRYCTSEMRISNTYNQNIEINEIKSNIDQFKINNGRPLKLNFTIKKEVNNNNIQSNNKIKERKNLLNRIFKKEIMNFHLYELIILEERLKNIILLLNKNKSAYYECYDFLTYFKNNCDILKNLNLLIKSEYDLKIIQKGINYILISIIFAYDYSYKQGILNNIILYMKEMINLAYQNLILIYDYFFKRTLISQIKNIYSIKLVQLISNELSKLNKETNINLDCIIISTDNNTENKNSIETIKNNTNFILQSIKIIIKNYKNKNSNSFLLFLKDIYQKTSFTDIFYFYQNKILNSNGLFTYLSPNIILRQNSNLFNDIVPPYIKTYSRKKYTLILGLENTLINFRQDSNLNFNLTRNYGSVELRPGLFPFLSEMKKHFEIILFSLYTKKIADYIINIIEQKEKYFDFKFYVQHSIIIENEFTKELKRIGRPIDKIIIVDNYPQNYKMNKKNAINIKSYWGKNYNDNILNELGKILINIIKDDDVRNGIEKYTKEIVEKISSNSYIDKY